MKITRKAALIAALMLAVPVGYAVAQVPHMMHARPSPETMQRMLDGRIAMAKTALRLTDDQQKLWAPVEDMIRASAAERMKQREEWMAKRADAGKAEAGKPAMALPERIEKRSEMMTQRAEKLKQFAAVLKPLYATFNDDQKAVAGTLVSMMGGRHGGHNGHQGWGHHGMMGMAPKDDAAPK